MKKVLLLLAILFSLSSCTMFPDRMSDQQIFYGDKLFESREIPRLKKVNSSFIYNYEDDHIYDDCKECQSQDNY